MIQKLFNNSEDTFPLSQNFRDFYGPFGFPEPRDDRPFISSNFVMSLDGLASYRELPGRNSGREVSRSADDQWMMDFLRVHHDALIMAANTLREERGPDGLGWDYRIRHEDLLEYRHNTLKLGKNRVILLTGSGEVDPRFHLFNSDRVEVWIITSKAGSEKIKATEFDPGRIKVISIGESTRIDLKEVMRILRQEHQIKTLLCEGGPTFYGQLLDAKLIDDDFRTVSAQVIGKSTNSDIPRPTAYGNVSYFPETAPWFELISLHASLPHHLFMRWRYKGPRKFD